jgi:hypothetical protein
MAFEHDRAQIQRRAVGQNRPFAHSAKFSRHKSTKETVKTIRVRECRVNRGVTAVTTLVCFFILHTRLRVLRAPGIPCAL